jgi:hypothetical protein
VLLLPFAIELAVVRSDNGDEFALCAPAPAQRCAGEGELLFGLTRHCAILPVRRPGCQPPLASVVRLGPLLPGVQPRAWDDKFLSWQKKRFVKAGFFAFFYMPVNFGNVMRTLDRKIRNYLSVIQYQ